MVTLAFYKGHGGTALQRAADAAVRRATGGQYSHVELIPGRATFGPKLGCLSSSGRDGGVREKWMALDPARWDLVPVPGVASIEAGRFILDRIGQPYDYRGLLMSHVVALGGQSPGRWFCSEICAAAIGLQAPHRFSPQLLFHVVTWAG